MSYYTIDRRNPQDPPAKTMAKRAKSTASPVKETRFSGHLRCHRTAYSLIHILIRIPAEQHIQKEKQYQRGGGCSQPHRCSQYHGTQLVYAETYPISKYILIKDCKPEPLSGLHLLGLGRNGGKARRIQKVEHQE